MIRPIGNKIKAIFTEDGFTACNCLLIEDDVNVMIDSGAGRILSEVDTAAVDILINSHRHLDHIWGNERMANAKVLAHPLERTAMQDPYKVAALDGWNQLMNEDFKTKAGELGALAERLQKPWRVDGEINDGETIDCGGTSMEVLLTPGHTSGHCSFFFPKENLVFMADICLSAVGPWYGEEQSDIDDFLTSIDRIIALKPKMILTGHRTTPVDKDIPEVLGEYRNRLLKREDRILQCVQGHPLSIDELAEMKIIYREHPSIFVLYWEKSMIKKHLEHLIKSERAQKREDGRYQAK
jgi:glyoxylase-like metal-dependent hydrolase (beta-lactamase superfamily II)